MPTLKLDGDAAGGVKAAADTAKGVDKIGEAFKKAAKEGKALERAAADIVKNNETAQERYNRKFNDLLTLLHKNKISTKDYERQLARLRNEMDSAGRSQDQAFGAGALGGIKSYFGALVGPGALIAGAIQSIRAYNTELDTLSSKLQGGRSGLGQLAQLAVTASDTPEGRAAAMAKYEASALRLHGMGATTSIGEAGNLVFALESAGITSKKDQKMVGRLLASGVLPDAGGFASGVAALRSAFPELTPDQLLGMGIVAAVPSPGGAEGVVQATAESAEQLSALGFKPGFGLAATSILSRAYGGASNAKTRLSSFGKQLEKFGQQNDPAIVGMDPFQIMDRIAAGGMGRENLERYFGDRQEAIEGFRTMYKNRGELRNLTTAASGADAGIVEQMLSLATNTPSIENSRQQLAASNRREISRLGPQSTDSLLQALRDENVQGRGALSTGVIDFFTAMGRMRGEQAGIDTLRTAATDPLSRQSLEGTEGGRDLLMAIERHLKNIDSKTNDVRNRPKGKPE